MRGRISILSGIQKAVFDGKRFPEYTKWAHKFRPEKLFTE